MSPARAPNKIASTEICIRAKHLLGENLQEGYLTTALGAVSNLYCFHVAEQTSVSVTVLVDGFACAEVATKEQVNLEIRRALPKIGDSTANKIREALFAAVLEAVQTAGESIRVDGFGLFARTSLNSSLSLAIEHPLSGFLEAQRHRWGTDALR